MINIELTPFEALEFCRWKSLIVKEIHNGPDPLQFGDKMKIVNVVNSIDRQIQDKIYLDVTVGTMHKSYVESLQIKPHGT